MISYLFNSQSPFQLTLHKFISEDTTSINEPSLHKIMRTLRGQNQDTKSQFAFASLKKMVTSFDLSRNEEKTLKLLVVFDKLVQDHFYCEQISKINFFFLEVTKNSESVESSEKTKILKIYWKLIKEKAAILNEANHIFHEKRSQRKSYFQRMKTVLILNQLSILQSFFGYIFELAYFIEGPNYSQRKQEGKSSKIMEYILLHILYKLLGLYNCQMMAHKYLIHKLKAISQTDTFRFKRFIEKFRQNCNQFINFIKTHQSLNGFELIHFEEIKVEVNEKLMRYIDDYLQTLEVDMQPQLNNLPLQLGKIVVEKKSLALLGKKTLNCRLIIKGSLSGESSCFENWQNSYSHEFPQKEVMTVDLIMQIKLEESLSLNQQRQDSEENFYLGRCSYDNRSTNVTSNYEINWFSKKQYAINVPYRTHFQNLYSKLESKWNPA